MPLLVNDEYVEQLILAEREATDGSKHDEVWNGTYVMSPLPNIQHQILASLLWQALHTAIGHTGLVINGVNVSDRDDGWVQNYREPDLAVVLDGNPAKNCDTHWCGGPDFLVEILSRNDLARDKRGFYAGIGVRELLIVDRDPWALELYRLANGRLDQAGRSTPDQPDVLTSTVLPLTFQLVPGPKRPQIEVAWSAGGQTWLV